MYRSKYRSILDYAGRTDKYRPFQAKSKNRPVQKSFLKKIKNKNKTKHKSTRWLTLPSSPTPLCWSLLTFSWLSIRPPPLVSSVHFPSFFTFSFFSSSYLLFRLQLPTPPLDCPPVGDFGHCPFLLRMTLCWIVHP